MSRADDIIHQGRCGAILHMALNAHMRAEDGVFCECAEPALSGMDLMCGNCLLENRGQREKRLALINSPHAFEPLAEAGIKAGFCRVCIRPADDPRHDALTPKEEG